MAEQGIHDTITIDASRDEVFRALTERRELETWMATKVESDAKTGGRFRYEFEYADAQSEQRAGATR